MNCDKAKELIELYILDDLPESDKELVENHLKECDDCRSIADDYTNIFEMLDKKHDATLSEVEKEKLKSSLNLETKPVSSFNKRFLQIAAAIIIFFMGYFSSYLVNESFSQDLPKASTPEASYTKATINNYRFTAEGLKVIANGKKALSEMESK